MEISVRDTESETRKWRSVLVNVSVCLLTSRLIPEHHFHFRASRRGFGVYKDTKMAQHCFKITPVFGLVYRYYILNPYVESTDETSRLI